MNDPDQISPAAGRAVQTGGGFYGGRFNEEIYVNEWRSAFDGGIVPPDP